MSYHDKFVGYPGDEMSHPAPILKETNTMPDETVITLDLLPVEEHGEEIDTLICQNLIRILKGEPDVMTLGHLTAIWSNLEAHNQRLMAGSYQYVVEGTEVPVADDDCEDDEDD